MTAAQVHVLRSGGTLHLLEAPDMPGRVMQSPTAEWMMTGPQGIPEVQVQTNQRFDQRRTSWPRTLPRQVTT